MAGSLKPCGGYCATYPRVLGTFLPDRRCRRRGRCPQPIHGILCGIGNDPGRSERQFTRGKLLVHSIAAGRNGPDTPRQLLRLLDHYEIRRRRSRLESPNRSGHGHVHGSTRRNGTAHGETNRRRLRSKDQLAKAALWRHDCRVECRYCRSGSVQDRGHGSHRPESNLPCNNKNLMLSRR